MIFTRKFQYSSVCIFLLSLGLAHQSWGAATRAEAKALPAGAVELGGDFTKIAISGPAWSIYYGAKDKYFTLTGSGQTPLACEPGTFGGDPMPNVAKKCFAVPQCDPETKEPKSSKKCYNVGAEVVISKACAADNQNCSYESDGVILYGVFGAGKFLKKDVSGKGSIACSPATFGSDPAPNVVKNCYHFPVKRDRQEIVVNLGNKAAPVTFEVGDSMSYTWVESVDDVKVLSGEGKFEDFFAKDHKPVAGGGFNPQGKNATKLAGPIKLTALKPGKINMTIKWVKFTEDARTPTQATILPDIPATSKFPFAHTEKITVAVGDFIVLHAGYEVGRLKVCHRASSRNGNLKVVERGFHYLNDFDKPDTHYIQGVKAGDDFLSIEKFDCLTNESLYRGPWQQIPVKVYEP